jgi:N-acetylglucosamine-6-phosphate deacetylase
MRIRGRDPKDGAAIEIAIRDGMITEISSARHEDQAWLSAGLIDLQVNGYAGEDLNADGLEPDVVIALTERMLEVGVTTFLPTLITASEEKIKSALRAIAEARRASKLVADAVPYVHVEGPHISEVDGFRGAHPREHVRPADLAEFYRWQEASGGLVGMITLSPHAPGIEDYIAAVTKHGVVVALGHTHAEPEQIRRAVDAGARLSTHLGNGIAATIDRHRNGIWPQLADDRLSATLIADGHHVPADMLKAVIRAKGMGRSILVSDTVAVGGKPPGVYQTPVGGQVRLEANGRLGLVGTEYLAGAVVPLKDDVARLCEMTGTSLSDSLAMATIHPGRFVGGRGIIEVGARADLIRFTVETDPAALQISSVIVAGREWLGLLR